MKNKRFINAAQNAALLLLTISALFLLTRTPLLPGGWLPKLPITSPAAAFIPQPETEELDNLLGSVHVMVTDDSEYGRCGRLCVPSDDALMQQIIPLLREALGSAAGLDAASHQEFRSALDGAGVYLDFMSELPLSALAACLGETMEFDRPVRAAALAAGTEDTEDTEDSVALYLLNNDGGLFRCATALPGSAVRGVCGATPPDGGCFAYETNYSALSPYTILTAQDGQPPSVRADLPTQYTAYNLLSALDFNPHTNSRYTDRDGAEVVEESPRTLRVSPDGTVAYTGGSFPAQPLYRVSFSGESPGLPESLRAASRLADALTAGTGASPLYLHAAEETETGCIIRFQYQIGGIPVRFTDEADALAVTISGAAVTGFLYRCRSYAPLVLEEEIEDEEAVPLLPPSIAASIASLFPDGGLEIAYVDGGTGRLTPRWLSF